MLIVVLLCMLTTEWNILIVGKGPTQGLDDITLTAEAEYTINFTFWFVNGVKTNSA